MKKTLILLLIGLTLFGEKFVANTDEATATAYNNGRKIRYFSPDSNIIGLTYSGYDSTRWALSQDNGATWIHGVIEKGSYPSLDVRVYSSIPFGFGDGVQRYPPIYEWDVVWKEDMGLAGGYIYAAQSQPKANDPVPTFPPPDTLGEIIVDPETGQAGVSSPAVENAWPINHVVVEVVEGTYEPATYHWYLIYGRYDEYWNQIDTFEVIDSYVTSRFPQPHSPSITVDNNGYPHVVYMKRDSIFYSTRDSTGVWSTPHCLSISGSPAGEPFISYWGAYVRAVWREEDPVSGLGVLWTQRKNLTTNSWEYVPVRVPLQNFANDNHWPQVVADNFYTWSEKDSTGDWDIKVVGPGLYYDSNDPDTNSRYSQIDYSDYGYLACAWAKGNTEPYAVVETTFTVSLPAYYPVSVGDSIPSPYTVYRDGYIVYPSGISVDYAENTLEYHLPYLNAEYAYTLVVIGYHESTGKWNEQVKIDGKKGKVLKVKAGEPDTVTIDIPLEYYQEDNAVDLTIKNLTGDYAAVSGIYLYQKPRKTPGIGGPQLSGAKIPSRFYVKLISNPSRSIATIEYSLRNRTNVNLRIYDIAGRLIAEPINREMDAGVHRIIWRGNAVGIYFYRLKAGKETATGKIILVK